MTDAGLAALRAIRVGTAVALAAFSLYTAAFGVLPVLQQLSLHLTAVLVLVFVPSPDAAARRGATLVLSDLALAMASVVVIGYHYVFYQDIADRYGVILDYEVWFGVAAVAILLEATRRLVGWPLAVLGGLFAIYAVVGRMAPGGLQHRGYSVERTVAHLYLGADGIFGTPLTVAATYVIIIVLFGTLLERTGAGQVLMDVATALTGRTRGGPAKAAVVGSSLMGMISGTAVANVLTTGAISIPLMRRTGYKAHVAGGIEAAASTGGQLMPPIMGAAAFIMADITETPYMQIAAAAIIPALLYYVAVFMGVHLEAVRTGVRSLHAEELPGLVGTLLARGHLLLSIPVFVYLLATGYSVMYSAFFAIVAALVLTLLKSSTRLGPLRLARALAAGAEAVLTVSVACATAGIVIGIISLTGLGLKFSSFIITLSGGNLLIALVLTMAASLVLGMGLPTAAAYILVAALVAPALVGMGVEVLAAHFFVFYSAMLSAITPPVALAAYAAAGLADANPLRIAAAAVRFGVPAFIVPYFFAYEPLLLGQGALAAIVGVTLTALVGVVCFAAALGGWLYVRSPWWERLALGATAAALISPTRTTDVIGLPLLTLVVLTQFWRWRREHDSAMTAGRRLESAALGRDPGNP